MPIVDISPKSPFTLHNIPFGVFSLLQDHEGQHHKMVGTAIGDYAVDLKTLSKKHQLSLTNAEGLKLALAGESLNAFMALGKPVWKEVRGALIELFSRSHDKFSCVSDCFHLLKDVRMHLPIVIGDYTDFYASKEHASNVGEMFRGKDNALMPNWLHIPVGYHGRASSIVVSETPIKRPKGQSKPPEGPPVFGPSKKLDFELEMAFVIGKGNALGTPIEVNEAKDYIFGVCVMNDWSARDIQAWEYVPLGPFLGKNFATTLSPWIITLDALEPFLASGPSQSPQPLAYLQEAPHNTGYDVDLEVKINESTVCKSNLKYLYWSFAQQLAHHSANGCNMRIGDICGTGTISGPEPDSFGSMLELSWNGSKRVPLGADGSDRTYLEDGDVVTMTAWCKKGEITLGFGECSGKIVPSD